MVVTVVYTYVLYRFGHPVCSSGSFTTCACVFRWALSVMGWGWRPAECGGRGSPALVWAWVFLLAWAASWAGRAEGCDMGELRCHDGSCVSADQYCDGEADCPGSEDEPDHCTREYPASLRLSWHPLNLPLASLYDTTLHASVYST